MTTSSSTPESKPGPEEREGARRPGRAGALLRQHGLALAFLLAAGVFIWVGLRLKWDREVMAGLVVLFGILSHAFAGLLALITMVPVVGPLVVKVLSIPVFWLLNALGYFVAAVLAKKGHGISVVSARILTTALLVGIVIGFILGKLI